MSFHVDPAVAVPVEPAEVVAEHYHPCVCGRLTICFAPCPPYIPSLVYIPGLRWWYVADPARPCSECR